jgi:hypothetical protein
VPFVLVPLVLTPLVLVLVVGGVVGVVEPVVGVVVGLMVAEGVVAGEVVIGEAAVGGAVVGGAFVGEAVVGRFGYVVVMQQPRESAPGPVRGAWSKVIAISPPSLYAADALISGTTLRRKASAAWRPVGCPGTHSVSEPSLQRPGTT